MLGGKKKEIIPYILRNQKFLVMHRNKKKPRGYCLICIVRRGFSCCCCVFIFHAWQNYTVTKVWKEALIICSGFWQQTDQNLRKCLTEEQIF